MAFKQFYFTGVPGLGNVVVSHHAQERAAEDGITEEVFQRVLERGTDRQGRFCALAFERA